jgi:hypothetical protein
MSDYEQGQQDLAQEIYDIIFNQNCTKLLLTVLNILLFVLILAMIIYKLL